jgi:hypothetical protein
MFGPVGRGNYLDVGERSLRSLLEFVMDAGVRDLDLVAEIGKLESFSDLLLDLGYGPLRLSFAGGVEGLVDFVFELKIKLDAKSPAPTALDAFRLFKVGAVNLRIMLSFARLY